MNYPPLPTFNYGWDTLLIGGIAVQRSSEPRVTRDVDLTLLTGFGHEEEFVDRLLEAFPARITDAKKFALQRRVVLLDSPDGVGIDVSLAGFPFEEQAIRRATAFAYPGGIELRTCSAEDLMVFKLFASRPIDLRDALKASRSAMLTRSIGTTSNPIWRRLRNLRRLPRSCKRSPASAAANSRPGERSWVRFNTSFTPSPTGRSVECV